MVFAKTRTHRAARSRTYVSRHCEERSDEAIHSFFAWRDGLLRFARNEARGAARSRSRVLPSLRGAKRRSNPLFLYVARCIASRSPPTGRVRRTNWLMMQTTGSGLWKNRLRQSGRLAQLTLTDQSVIICGSVEPTEADL